jgi:hypothetical protein
LVYMGELVMGELVMGELVMGELVRRVRFELTLLAF